MADGGKGDAEDAPLLLHASWGGGGAAASPTVAASQASAAPTGGTPAFSPLSVQPSSRSEAGMQAGTCQLLARTGTSSGFGVGAGTSSGFGVGAARALHAPTSHWGITSALLLADMFGESQRQCMRTSKAPLRSSESKLTVLPPAAGIGSLALPGVFARLGWLLSFVLMGAFCLGCGYLGVLFTKLAVAQPTATTMDELGSAALGKMGKRLVFGAFYVRRRREAGGPAAG